jgi:hypothetical protein
VKAMGITPKKSKLREALHVELLRIIGSDPSFNKNRASKLATDLVNLADPLRPQKNLRYLWPKALK